MKTDNKQTNLIINLINSYRSVFELKKLLFVNALSISENPLNIIEYKNWVHSIGEEMTNNIFEIEKELGSKKGKYDLIFMDLPWGMRNAEWKDQDGKPHNLSYELIPILHCIKLINNSGSILAILPPGVLFNQKGKDFEKILNQLGYGYHAVFNFPEEFYKPITAIRPILCLIKKEIKKDIFISEVPYESDNKIIIQNFKNNLSNNVDSGLKINRDEFISFHNLQLKQQIDLLKQQYGNYDVVLLAKYIKKINTTTTVFIENENAIYIPKIGTTDPVYGLLNLRIKQHNYFQVILENQDKIKTTAQYLGVFFKSQMGKFLLSSIKKDSIIPHINKDDLLTMSIPIPDPDTQDLIIETEKKIVKLQFEIGKLASEISLNPTNAVNVQGLLNNALQAVGKLNDEEQILELIRQGECKTVEFKQTFNKDIKTNSKQKFIQESALKNIVALLNSDGGNLLIGIDDKGKISGVEDDFFESDDKYLLNFKNNIKDNIGEEYYPFIDWKIVQVKGMKILKVDCKPSDKACYLYHKDFYVRVNPSADKLEGPKLEQYIHERFYSKNEH